MSADEFERWDGAYVLGALSAADTQRYEAHLEECDECMRRVAELWALPDALALAAPDAFSSSADPQGEYAGAAPAQPAAVDVEPVPATLLPRLLREVARERTRRRALPRAGIVAVAASVALVAAVAGFGLTRPSSDPDHIPSQAVALTDVSDETQLVAKVQVVSTHSWDQVNLWCTYRGDAAYRAESYSAVAYDGEGHSQVVGQWPGIPGQTTVLRVPTTFHTGSIASVAIVTSGGQVVAKTSGRV